MALYQPLGRLDFLYVNDPDPAKHKLFIMAEITVPVRPGEIVPGPSTVDINTVVISDIYVDLYVRRGPNGDGEIEYQVPFLIEIPVADLDSLPYANPDNESAIAGLISSLRGLIEYHLTHLGVTEYRVTTIVNRKDPKTGVYQPEGQVQNHISQNGNVVID